MTESGQLTRIPPGKAELLFKATVGPSIPCDLWDTTGLPTEDGWTPDFTTDNILTSINNLTVGKAPGPDGITNAVLKN